MSDRRNAAYERASALASQALNSVAEVHAMDVAQLAEALKHLNGVLKVVASHGWVSSWAKDTAILEEARDFLAAVTEQEDNDGTTEAEGPDPAPGGPAGGPEGA